MQVSGRAARHRRALHVLVPVLTLLLFGCTGVAGARGPVPSPQPSGQVQSQAERSQQVLDALLDAGGPGCSAAVGSRGKVVWQGVRGMADLKTGAKITPDTVFDIGSISKQFTATAVLLLAEAGRLKLDDPLAEHLDGLPAWSHRVTLAQLMHHTSGIPDYQQRLLDEGHPVSKPTTQQQALQTLAAVDRLGFRPGSAWEYSNSNYLLLAEVVRRESGRTLPRFLQTRVFGPLQLAMVVSRRQEIPGKAVSYRPTGSRFSVADSPWQQIGDGGVQTTPSQLVRWADNYRTGTVGGPSWLNANVAAAVDTQLGDGARYGAGMFELPDGSLWHNGSFAGFISQFWISSGRGTAVALTCNVNTDGIDLEGMTETLSLIWTAQ
jgi:CubicO group peptidase (beta-lactamase class C family)